MSQELHHPPPPSRKRQKPSSDDDAVDDDAKEEDGEVPVSPPAQSLVSLNGDGDGGGGDDESEDRKTKEEEDGEGEREDKPISSSSSLSLTSSSSSPMEEGEDGEGKEQKKEEDGDDDEGEGEGEGEEETKGKGAGSTTISKEFSNPCLPISANDWRILAEAVTNEIRTTPRKDPILDATLKRWQQRQQATKDYILKSSMLTDTKASAAATKRLFDVFDFIEKPIVTGRVPCVFNGRRSEVSVLKLVKLSSKHRRALRGQCSTDFDTTPAHLQEDIIVISNIYIPFAASICVVLHGDEYLRRTFDKFKSVKDLNKETLKQNFIQYRDNARINYNRALAFLVFVVNSPIVA
jgi:hypothetical protein